jgi:hypothetical protein
MTAWFIYFVINCRIVSDTKYTHFWFKIVTSFSWVEQTVLDVVATVDRLCPIKVIQCVRKVAVHLKKGVGNDVYQRL